ncbi:MAG: TadE family type IV pilus minor pilin [Dermatophilaceae bacterium]
MARSHTEGRATRRPAPRARGATTAPEPWVLGEGARSTVPRLRGRGVRRGDAAARQSGIVTLEVALMMFALAFFLTASLTALATGIDHVRCSEAARVGARLAAREESSSQVVAGALDTAPRGSRVEVSTGGGSVTVTVRAPERPFFAHLGIHVAGSGTSVAPIEWTNGG